MKTVDDLIKEWGDMSGGSPEQHIYDYMNAQIDYWKLQVTNKMKTNEQLFKELEAKKVELVAIKEVQAVFKSRLEKAERDINDLREDDRIKNDGKNSRHIHSGGKGGWSV